MLKTMISLFVLLGFTSIARAEAHKFNSWDEACAAAASVVSEGDLIFLDIPSVLFRRVAAGSGTWTSHVGIAFKDFDGSWIVSESTVPLSKETPLCEYLNKSAEFKFEVMRLNRPLQIEELETLRFTANQLLHKFYTFGFDFDSARLYCSKFVYLTFQSIGVEVGRVQTFRELFEENPHTKLTFWRLWFLGRIPWERRTVTPGSQLNDTKFFSVLGGY